MPSGPRCGPSAPGSGGFFSSLSSSMASIPNTYRGMYHQLLGNTQMANTYYHLSYTQGPLGQSANGPWWSYYGTRGALALASAATTAAATAAVAEVALLGNTSVLVESGGVTPLFTTGISGSRGILQIRVAGQAPLMRIDFHRFVTGGTRFLHIDFLNRPHWPW